MLKINILPASKRLTVTYGSEELDWPYNVWGNLNKDFTDDIFGVTNGYLATLSKEKQDVLWSCYQAAHDAMLSIGQPTTLREELTEILNVMSDQLDYNDLHQWATTHGGVIPDLEIPETNITNNSDELTILRQEALEISTYAALVKVVAPIWGPYVTIRKDLTINIHKERYAARIFTDSRFTKWAPYVRLEGYTKELARIRSRSVDTALMWGMAKEDLDKFLMGHVLIRRLIPRVLRLSPTVKVNVNIVAYMYRFLEDKINHLSNSNYREKFPTGQSATQESDSISDQYRISQDIADSIPVGVEHYAEDITRLCKDVGIVSPNDVKAALQVRKAINDNPRYVLIDCIALALPAYVFRKKTSPAALRHVSRDIRLNYIAVTYIRAAKLGLQDVADLLTAVKEPTDMFSMQMGTQNGKSFRRLNNDLDDALAARYPHPQPADIKAKTNPGRRLIEIIIKEVDGSEWLGLNDVSDLRNSIAKFFIER